MNTHEKETDEVLRKTNDDKSLLELCLEKQWEYIENTMKYKIHEWDFTERDEDNFTPLLICCKKGQLSTLRAFHSILPTFDVKESTLHGSTMILAACLGGNIDMVRWLLEIGSSLRCP